MHTPRVTGNWGRPSLFHNRWIMLVGGAGYSTYVTHRQGKRERKNVVDFKNMATIAPHPSLHVDKSIPWVATLQDAYEASIFGHRAYSNAILVYDVLRNEFFWSDSLPIDINQPQTVMHGDDMILVGGETSMGCAFGKAFGRHADTLIRLRLNVSDVVVADGLSYIHV